MVQLYSFSLVHVPQGDFKKTKDKKILIEEFKKYVHTFSILLRILLQISNKQLYLN